MDILNVLKKLRDDLKVWVTNNLNALNRKIDEKTIPIDNELDSSSTNPVQNKVVTNAINNIEYDNLKNAPDIFDDGSDNLTIVDPEGRKILTVDEDGVHTTAVTIDGQVAATEKYVSGQINAHNISEKAHADIRQAIKDAKEELSNSIVAESNEWKVVDEAGNIIFSVDANGAHTTELTLDGKKAATEEYVNDAIGNIEIPEPPEVNYPDIEIVDDTTITAAEENLVNVYKDLTVDETNGHILHEELVTVVKKEYVDEAINNLPEWTKAEEKPTITEWAQDDDHLTVTKDEKDTWNSKSDFSGNYEDLNNAPSIEERENGELIIADPEGNIAFRVDEGGVEVTNIIVDGISVKDKDETLAISDKTIVGAINELYENVCRSEIVGTWIFNDTPVLPNKSFEIKFTDGLGTEYGAIDYSEVEEMFYYSYELGNLDVDAYFGCSGEGGEEWAYEEAKIINILEEPTDETFISWLKANATKQVIEYQKKTDYTLETESKEIVGAINELNSKINEGGAEDVEESMVGTWVFNDEPSLGYLTPTVQYEISFISNGIQYRSIRRQPTGPSSAGIFSIIYEGENDTSPAYNENPDGLHGIPNGWCERAYKFITITEEPTNETIKTWVKSSAKRYEPIGADRVGSIDTYAGGVFDLGFETDNSLTWRDDFQFSEGVDLGGSQITNGTIYHRVPIAGGNNVTIRIDEDTNLARIDSGEYSLGLEYTFHDFYYNVAGIGNCQDSIIRIPPTHNGYPVTGIEDLKNTPQITEIILPNSIGEIFDYAFDGCQYLTKLYIPRSVYVVGEDICSASEKVTIYCEFSEEEISAAHSWSQEWNAQGCPVKWSSPREVFDITDAIDSRLPVTNFTLRNDTPILDLKALADKAGTTPFIIHSKEGDYTGIWIVQIGNAYSDNYYASFTQLQAGFIFNYSSSKLFNSSSDFVFYDFIQEPQRVLTTYSSELSTEDKNLINVVNGLVADVGNISGALDSIIAQTNTIIGGTE